MTAPRSWTLQLPYETLPLSLNDRDHRMVVWRAQHNLRNQVRMLARSVNIPRLERIHVQLHYRPITVRSRDQDNAVATLKPAIDGLRDYPSRHKNGQLVEAAWTGIVPDDTPPTSPGNHPPSTTRNRPPRVSANRPGSGSSSPRYPRDRKRLRHQTLTEMAFIADNWTDLLEARQPGTARPWRQALLDPERRAAMAQRDREERATATPTHPASPAPPSTSTSSTSSSRSGPPSTNSPAHQPRLAKKTPAGSASRKVTEIAPCSSSSRPGSRSSQRPTRPEPPRSEPAAAPHRRSQPRPLARPRRPAPQRRRLPLVPRRHPEAPRRRSDHPPRRRDPRQAANRTAQPSKPATPSSAGTRSATRPTKTAASATAAAPLALARMGMAREAAHHRRPARQPSRQGDVLGRPRDFAIVHSGRSGVDQAVAIVPPRNGVPAPASEQPGQAIRFVGGPFHGQLRRFVTIDDVLVVDRPENSKRPRLSSIDAATHPVGEYQFEIVNEQASYVWVAARKVSA
jgi:hypothetical protein